ncbi:MAG: DUF86 domain-containing protein [Bryobacterales bacterium]|nr:DUF86 domain-containing protein [Bryobacterales bacterium]
MPSRDPRQRMRDILENIEAVLQFTAGMTFDQFAADRRTVYAVTRALEIISEAHRRLPEEYKRTHPEIDRPAIAAAGNLYRHEYEAVDETILWKTRSRLAGLQAAIAEDLDMQ